MKGPRPCPVCDGTSAVALHRQGFVLADDVRLPPAYDIVACASCGAVYADTRAGQGDYDRYYAAHSRYEDPAVATGGGDSPEDRRRLGDTADLLASHVGSRRRSMRVLDVGCARGGLLCELRSRGFRDLAGVDPSRECVEQVRRQGFDGIEAHVLDLPARVIRDSCDLIVLSHVLEHLVEVRAAVERIVACLAPGGLLYVEVPDASRYAHSAFVPFYFFDPEHINHFDGASLANLAAVHGLRMRASGQRDLTVGRGLAYPVVWALLAHTPGASAGAPVFDNGLRERIEHYVHECAARNGCAELEALAARGTEVLLWGAGSHAQRLLQASPLRGCRVVAIVDRDSKKQGGVLAGCRVQHPEEAVANLSPEVVIVIASAIHAHAIGEDVRRLGLRNRVVLAQ